METGSPFSVSVDFSKEYASLDSAGRRAFLDSIRVVRTDPVSGEPLMFNKDLEGDEQYFVPFQVSDNLYWEAARIGSFSKHWKTSRLLFDLLRCRRSV